MDKRDVLDAWFQRFWCDEDLSAIDDMVSVDTDVRGLTDVPKVGPDGLRAFAEAMLKLISIDSVEIEHFMETGDWAQILATFHAVGRSNGVLAPFTAQILVKIEDDKITDAYNHPDFITLYQHLGLMPVDTIERCLSGQGLA